MNGKRLFKTHEVLDLSRERTVSALVLEPDKCYMWNIKTLNKKNSENDEWFFDLMEAPYSEHEIMCEGEDHPDTYCYIKYLCMQYKKKIRGGKRGVEVCAPLNRIMFWVSGESVGCDFCDVVWIKVWLTQYEGDKMFSNEKSFEINIPFFIEK